jgi:hypothetical protein
VEPALPLPCRINFDGEPATFSNNAGSVAGLGGRYALLRSKSRKK